MKDFFGSFLSAGDEAVTPRDLPGDPRGLDPGADLLGGRGVDLVAASLGDQHLLDVVLAVATSQTQRGHALVVLGVDVGAPVNKKRLGIRVASRVLATFVGGCDGQVIGCSVAPLL